MSGLCINQRLFRKTCLASLAALCAAILIMIYTTAVYGLSLDLDLPLNLPALYDGGFIVESGVIDGSGCMLYPIIQDVNSDSGASKHLMIRITMDDVNIQNMKMTKVVPLPSHLQVAGYEAYKITITADGLPVTVKGLKMDNSSMKCTIATLGLFEQNSSGVMKAISMKIEDAKIVAHHMEAQNITIPYMRLNIELCDSSGN